MPVDIRQPHVPAAEAIRQLRVVDPHKVQHRGVEVVDHELLLDDPVAEVVGGTGDRAPLHAAASQPHRECLWVVVAAIGALGKRRPPEFTAPDHECGVEHPTVLEIPDQGRDGLIDRPRVVGMPLAELVVLIPAIGIDRWAGELHEPHSPLHHPAGQQALGAENLRRLVLGLEPVGPFRFHRFA